MEAEKADAGQLSQLQCSSNKCYTGLSIRNKKRHLASKIQEISIELNKITGETSPRNQPYTVDIGKSNISCESNYANNILSVNDVTINVNLPNSSLPKLSESTLMLDTNDSVLKSFLVSWSKQHNISHSALNHLLEGLRVDHPSLPKDARILLHTPRSINVVQCAGGSYVYFGLANQLKKRASAGLCSNYYPLMQRKLSQSRNTLTITLNVDGLPVHSSSSNSFWPILSILDQSIDKEPIIVGLYYGSSKPDNANDYLRPFVDECLHLEKHGLIINGQHYSFRVSCIIADAPARSFLKSIKSFNSLYGCEKCEQEGIYLGRTVWLYTSNMRLRTDVGFSNQLYDDEHQQSKSILSELDVGLVTQVPLDYMHLVCLGVVKKLIRCWLENGPKKCKMNASKIGEISERLRVIRDKYPTEFSRRPRPINVFKYWKASEFRAFVLYLGPVVLRGVLSKTLYKHFLLLHCAIYILSTANICQHDEWRKYASDLLHCFVRYMSDLYCNEFLVYNVHNLLHLADDVYNFGPLDSFSAFPFENFMSKIKNMVRGHNMPLEQVAKRLGENCNSERKNVPKTRPIKEQNGQIRKIHYNDYVIGTSPRDSCFVTLNGDIVIVKSIVESDESSYTLRCDCFLNKTDFYKEPIQSSKYSVNNGPGDNVYEGLLANFFLRNKSEAMSLYGASFVL